LNGFGHNLVKEPGADKALLWDARKVIGNCYIGQPPQEGPFGGLIFRFYLSVGKEFQLVVV